MSEPDEGVMSERQADLLKWWRTVSESDAQQVLPKMSEYGAYDLSLIGQTLTDILDRENVPLRESQEMGCFFYLLGKVARMASAYKEGRLPSDDTIHDAVVYLMMIRRIRTYGEWG